MADDPKSERLGVRGSFAIYDSTIRLLGGANATGALAAGAAFHTFDGRADLQGDVKAIACLFLLGVGMFTIAYLCWFITVFSVDQALAAQEEAPADIWRFSRRRPRTFEQNRRAARTGYLLMVIAGAASFSIFFVGLSQSLALLRI